MRPNRSAGVDLPTLPDWGRNLLIGLFALYALELFLANLVRLPVYELAWSPLRAGFAVWQPLTHYLVQGPGVLGVVISGFVLGLMLPSVNDMSTRKLSEFIAFSAMGGLVLGFLMDAAGLLNGAAMGWSGAVTALLVLFGLRNPTASVLLFFVIPVQARLFVWGTGVLSFLFLLAGPSLATAEYFGIFLGTMAWWNLRGPAARRRELVKKAMHVERELRSFQVIEGGKNRPKDKGSDDVIH